MRPYIDRCPSSYFFAAGNNSSSEIKTMMPATAAKINPNITSFRNGINIRKATMAPTGSAKPDKKESLNAFFDHLLQNKLVLQRQFLLEYYVSQ